MEHQRSVLQSARALDMFDTVVDHADQFVHEVGENTVVQIVNLIDEAITMGDIADVQDVGPGPLPPQVRSLVMSALKTFDAIVDVYTDGGDSVDADAVKRMHGHLHTSLAIGDKAGAQLFDRLTSRVLRGITGPSVQAPWADVGGVFAEWDATDIGGGDRALERSRRFHSTCGIYAWLTSVGQTDDRSALPTKPSEPMMLSVYVEGTSLAIFERIVPNLAYANIIVDGFTEHCLTGGGS
jgi:hypothetical protein